MDLEAALRDTAIDIRDTLLKERFDGHKGMPLAFDPVTRVLIQPVYVVTGTGANESVVFEGDPPEPA